MDQTRDRRGATSTKPPSGPTIPAVEANILTKQPMRVPLIKPDIPSFDILEGPFREVLANGKITNFGKYVTRFEQAVADYLAVPVVSVSSGTMALVFALQAMGLAPGNKVIVPSFTFMATVQAILYAGAIPVFADIGDDLTLEAGETARLLDKHPDARAIVAVHMYGLPCDVEALQEVARTFSRRTGNEVKLLYDAAHAFGSRVGDRKVGGFGLAEVFSLSVTKVLVSVEGGLVASRDPDFLARVRSMRNYGIGARYNAVEPGMNGKMSELHAIVGLANLARLDHAMQTRQANAARFFQAIEARTSFRRVPGREGTLHTYKDFTVLVPDAFAGRRDRLIEFLDARGIETRAYFSPPVHQQSHFRRWADRELPRTENLSRRVLTLPFFTTITQEEMDYVVSGLEAAERALA